MECIDLGLSHLTWLAGQLHAFPHNYCTDNKTFPPFPLFNKHQSIPQTCHNLLAFRLWHNLYLLVLQSPSVRFSLSHQMRHFSTRSEFVCLFLKKNTLCAFRKSRNPVWMSWYMTAAWKHQKSQVNFICIAHLNNIIYINIYTPMYKCIYIHTFRHIQTCLHHSVTLSHNKYRQNSKACEKWQVIKKSCLMCHTDLSWLVL